MTRPALLAALALALSAGAASADTVAPTAGALAPHAAARAGLRPRGGRAAHCERKADSIGVQGPARAIYLRKCGRV